jgi:hypothetical protein
MKQSFLLTKMKYKSIENVIEIKKLNIDFRSGVLSEKRFAPSAETGNSAFPPSEYGNLTMTLRRVRL